MLNSKRLFCANNVDRHWLYKSVSVLMLLYMFAGLCYTFLIPQNYNNFSYTEFLINFEGGFVRRGLVGQGLFELIKLTGWNPYTVMQVFCGVVFIVVLSFFLYKFKQNNLNWWILFSPFLFGLTLYIIRKDYLCYAIMIMVLYLFRDRKINSLKLFSGAILISFILFVHEGAFFYAVPVFGLLLLSSSNSKIVSSTVLSVVLLLFLLLVFFKGNQEVADSIYKSWLPYIDNPAYEPCYWNSIGAIGWNTSDAIKFHFLSNFYNEDIGAGGFFFQIVFAITAYYFIMNFLYVFRRKNSSFNEESRTLFSSVFLFVLICMIPMFLVLSCDKGRLYQYSVMTALSVFLIIPPDRIKAMFPSRYLRFVKHLKGSLNKVIVPTKGVMLILLLMFAPEPFGFTPLLSLRYSVIGQDIRFIVDSFSLII